MSHIELLKAKSYAENGEEMLNGYRLLHQRGYRIRRALDSMFILRPFFPHFNMERVIVCGLDNQLNVIYAKQMFSGTKDRVDANPNMVVRKMLEANAEFYIICHNHPEGHSLKPSAKDREFTKMCDNKGRRNGLVMLDHMVICQHRYWSFRRNGGMRKVAPEDVGDLTRPMMKWRESVGWFGRKKIGDIQW